MEFVVGTLATGAAARIGVDGGRIVSVVPAENAVGYVVPGFVDQHCHGGGGWDVAADPARVAQFHAEHGTTTLLASLVTADRAALAAQVQSLVGEPTIAGVHLEGPWLSADQCGAHDVAALRAPDPAEMASLLESGIIRMVTIAPELPGALDAIRYLVDAGVVVAIGHTDCDYDTAVRALDAGATVATHLFNRMPAFDKRNPGPVLALLEDPRVSVELIPDGHHVDPGLVRYIIATAGAHRVACITDAISAAGAGDGQYRLGRLDVTVTDGVARLTGQEALAGSTLTCDVALRGLVAAGVPLSDAVLTLTQTPARALGLSDRGVLAVGFRADLVVLDEDLSVRRVMQAGRWVV